VIGFQEPTSIPYPEAFCGWFMGGIAYRLRHLEARVNNPLDTPFDPIIGSITHKRVRNS
jgi:hypothetical protein